MCYCDARSFTAQRCVAQCAALYSPPRNFWVREQQNNQCYNDLKRYRRCARLLLSAQLIYIKLFSPPLPAQHCTHHCTVSSATRQHCTQHCTVPSATSRARKCPTCAMRPSTRAQHCTVSSATSRARKCSTCAMRPYSAQHNTVSSATLHR
jgi:hypothetical protein